LEQPLEYFFNFDYWLNEFRISADDLLPLPFSLSEGAADSSGEHALLKGLLPPLTRVEFTPLN
jgi:hypothetical protein